MINEEIKNIIKYSLIEDIGNGDITSEAIFENETAVGEFLLKSEGVVTGLEIAKEVFIQLDSNIKFTSYVDEGSFNKSNIIIAKIEGKVKSLLTGERTALNFMQRMSGISTSAYLLQNKISHTKAKILDTRKTAPGLRVIDKLAFKMSGLENHRIGLYDMFLIKDNHIAAAGSIKLAIEKCRSYMNKSNNKYKIEVEVKNIEETKEALSCNPDIIMFDNFSLEELKKGVELVNNKCLTEASGGITEETIIKVAETGVDFISVGAITHSVKALDISFNLIFNNK